MKEYDAYLFDADGTLFDTADMIHNCFVHTAKKFANKTISKEQVFKSIGLPFRPQLEKLIGSVDDKLFDEIIKSHIDYQMTIYKDFLKPFPYVKKTLSELTNRGKKLAVVTSRKIPSLTLYLKHTELLNYFEVLVTPESTKKHKPEPEPALKAVEKLSVNTKESLFIGDAIFDLRCAKSAGMDSALVRWSTTFETCKKEHPNYIIKEMTKLLNWSEN